MLKIEAIKIATISVRCRSPAPPGTLGGGRTAAASTDVA